MEEPINLSLIGIYKDGMDISNVTPTIFSTAVSFFKLWIFWRSDNKIDNT